MLITGLAFGLAINGEFGEKLYFTLAKFGPIMWVTKKTRAEYPHIAARSAEKLNTTGTLNLTNVAEYGY